MSIGIASAACAAVLASAAIAAGAQATPQTPTQSPVQGGTQGAVQQQTPRRAPTATAGEITVTGCVTRAAAGQFALVNAAASSDVPAPRGATGTSDTAAARGRGRTTGTSGRNGRTAAMPTSFDLSGHRAEELAAYVGQRVEIVGEVEAAGSAAGNAPAQADAAGDVGRTPVTRPEGDRAASAGSPKPGRLDVVSFRPVGGKCE